MPIFDQGYQHWSGNLSGRSWRWMAITRHGVRIGMKNSFMRLIILLAWMPAIALACALMIWGLMEQRSSLIQPIRATLESIVGQNVYLNATDYRIEIWTICYSDFLHAQTWFAMILILIAGPSLISQDIRFNAMPLYFSRPLRRLDYFLGKLGVIGFFLGMVLIVPSILAYVLGLLFSLDISIVADTIRLLAASLVYGILMTLSAGLFILALSSLSRNSRYIGLFWIGVWLIGSIVGTVLEGTQRQTNSQRAYVKAMGSHIQLQRSLAISAIVAGTGPTEALNTRLSAGGSKAYDEIYQDVIEVGKSDWRPLVSYKANLDRIGDALLGTNDCWQKLSQAQAPGSRSEYLLANAGPQYPWNWSAALLIVLCGICVCVLNFRVKSLDRLK